MTLEVFQNYLTVKLPLRMDTGQLVRLLLKVFVFVFAGAVVIDILIRPGADAVSLFVHGLSVGLTYAGGVSIAAMSLLLLRNAARNMRVWHLWGISLVGFAGGYYLLPWQGAARHSEPMSFGQLLPVWFVITYLFVQPYLNNSLRSELSRLRELNALLEGAKTTTKGSPYQPIIFESGRTRFTLSAGAIRNIVVDDHYCYVHFERDGTFRKRDIAMTLGEVMTLLPPEFVRVHRSHAVNLAHVVAVRRKGRTIRVLLEGGYEVPVSRHRLDDVLPALQQYAAPPA